MTVIDNSLAQGKPESAHLFHTPPTVDREHLLREGVSGTSDAVADPIFLRREHRTHRLVGTHIFMPQRDLKKYAWSAFEAWVYLNCCEFVTQKIPGDGVEPVTLVLAPDWLCVPDLSIVFNWPQSAARRWLSLLAEANMISVEVMNFAIGGMVARRRQRSSLPKATASTVLAKTSGKCVYCGVVLTTRKNQANTYHRDHVLSVADGGTDDIGNLVPSCATCNTKKGAKTMIEFLGGSNAP